MKDAHKSHKSGFPKGCNANKVLLKWYGVSRLGASTLRMGAFKSQAGDLELALEEHIAALEEKRRDTLEMLAAAGEGIQTLEKVTALPTGGEGG